MVCLGFEPMAAGCKSQTNPLSYGGTPKAFYYFTVILSGSKAHTFASNALTCNNHRAVCLKFAE